MGFSTEAFRAMHSTMTLWQLLMLLRVFDTLEL
jgi:hypothetical protein